MNKKVCGSALLIVLAKLTLAQTLGLPPVPIPADNPQTPEKIALGKKLFEDKRFSSTGAVSCSTCHDANKGFMDGPHRSKSSHSCR